MASLVHMQAPQEVPENERLRLPKVADNKARLQPVKAMMAALQSQQGPQLTDSGPATDSNGGAGSKKGKKRSRGQENNAQVPSCFSCDPVPAVPVLDLLHEGKAAVCNAKFSYLYLTA